MKKLLGIAAALAFFGAVSPASAAVNLIQNGSFEDGEYNFGFPDFNTLTPANNPTITNWVIGGASIDWIGTYWNEGPGAGNRSIDLSGLGQGSVSQSFGVTPGAWYEVNFLMAGNPAGGPTIKTMNVSTNGSLQEFSFDTTGKGVPDPMGWTEKSFKFQAVGLSETITFLSTSCCNDGDNPLAFGPALDLVSVSAVPEPSTWAMMLLGFAGVGYFAWRRNKKAAIAAA
jgi:choice-of-anchor C domain-containing protein